MLRFIASFLFFLRVDRSVYVIRPSRWQVGVRVEGVHFLAFAATSCGENKHFYLLPLTLHTPIYVFLRRSFCVAREDAAHRTEMLPLCIYTDIIIIKLHNPPPPKSSQKNPSIDPIKNS